MSLYARHFSDPGLDLHDDYWDKQGRKSIDAVAIFGGLLTMGVAGKGALQELGLVPKGRSGEAKYP